MEITEKVAYLKGLAEGMDLDTDKKVGKLLAAIIDTLDDRNVILMIFWLLVFRSSRSSKVSFS